MDVGCWLVAAMSHGDGHVRERVQVERQGAAAAGDGKKVEAEVAACAQMWKTGPFPIVEEVT